MSASLTSAVRATAFTHLDLRANREQLLHPSAVTRLIAGYKLKVSVVGERSFRERSNVDVPELDVLGIRGLAVWSDKELLSVFDLEDLPLERGGQLGKVGGEVCDLRVDFVRQSENELLDVLGGAEGDSAVSTQLGNCAAHDFLERLTLARVCLNHAVPFPSEERRLSVLSSRASPTAKVLALVAMKCERVS